MDTRHGQQRDEATPDVGPGEQIVCGYFPFENLETIPERYKDTDFEALRQNVVEDELCVLGTEQVVGLRNEKILSERRATAAQRLFVYLRDGCACVYCDIDIPNVESATIDHRKSFYVGGKTLVSNLTLSCAPCNSVKGAESEEWFRNRLQEGGLQWRNEEDRLQRDRRRSGL